MDLNLTATTHILELETSSSATIHYSVTYADLPASDVTPGSNQGTIASATTTTILSAPGASTTRKVQSLSLYNADTVSNTLILKKNISGTETILGRVILGALEQARIIDGVLSIYDSTGRQKSQAGDVEITGDNRALLKIGTAPEAAGVMYCFAKDSGFPGAYTVGTPGVNGRNTDGTTATDAGCINMGNSASGNWYLRALDMIATQVGQVAIFDVLWINSGLVVTTTTAQSITQPTLPARDNDGSTNGKGVLAGILVTAATTNAGAITNMTLSYTNQDGTAGRTATIASFPATAVIGTFVQFQLAAGDTGIRSIQSITLGTSLVTGSISLVCFNPLAYESINVINTGAFTSVKRDTKMYNGHCLLPFWWASGTGAVTINGGITFVNK